MARRRLKTKLASLEYRHAYSNAVVDDTIAFQIRTLRESRGFSQEELGKIAGMPQTAISRIETADYGKWTVSTLKRIASALDVSLSIRFQGWGDMLAQAENFTQESLTIPTFDQDPMFSPNLQYVSVVQSLLKDIRTDDWSRHFGSSHYQASLAAPVVNVSGGIVDYVYSAKTNDVWKSAALVSKPTKKEKIRAA